MTDLEDTVMQVCRLLERLGVPYMVIGGFATLIWGEPRLTRDIDVTVAIEMDRVAEFVESLPAALRPAVANPADFARQTHVIPLASDKGMRIDLIVASLPYERTAIERSVPVSVSGHEIRICSPEDLVIHKVISDRAKDREDARGVIQRHGDRFERSYVDPIIRELSEMLARPDIWEFYKSCFTGGQ
ncbi:MAG: nucleotidyl transferase AbiEii/AbiGii toxin family protein [Bacillota bacterium]